MAQIGFTSMNIPKDGLFVNSKGKLQAGDGTPITTSSLPIHPTKKDARKWHKDWAKKYPHFASKTNSIIIQVEYRVVEPEAK